MLPCWKLLQTYEGYLFIIFYYCMWIYVYLNENFNKNNLINLSKNKINKAKQKEKKTTKTTYGCKQVRVQKAQCGKKITPWFPTRCFWLEYVQTLDRTQDRRHLTDWKMPWFGEHSWLSFPYLMHTWGPPQSAWDEPSSPTRGHHSWAVSQVDGLNIAHPLKVDRKKCWC